MNSKVMAYTVIINYLYIFSRLFEKIMHIFDNQCTISR
jgi:hypothetical protein